MNLITTLGALMLALGSIVALCVFHWILVSMVLAKDYDFAVVFGTALLLLDGFLLFLLGASL